jgi:S1-C subfamily serine protease
VDHFFRREGAKEMSDMYKGLRPLIGLILLLALAALACGPTIVVEVTPTPPPPLPPADTTAPPPTPEVMPPTDTTETPPVQDTRPTITIDDLQAATVQILAKQMMSGRLRVAWTGSGTIVTPDGLILTNAHVAAPSAPGLATLYNDVNLLFSDEADQLVIAINVADDRPPVESLYRRNCGPGRAA